MAQRCQHLIRPRGFCISNKNFSLVFKMLRPAWCADIISLHLFSYSTITAFKSCAHGRIYNEVGVKNLWVSIELTDEALVIHTWVTLILSSICRLHTVICGGEGLFFTVARVDVATLTDESKSKAGFRKSAALLFVLWNYPHASGQKGVKQTGWTYQKHQCFYVSLQAHWTCVSVADGDVCLQKTKPVHHINIQPHTEICSGCDIDHWI